MNFETMVYDFEEECYRAKATFRLLFDKVSLLKMR